MDDLELQKRLKIKGFNVPLCMIKLWSKDKHMKGVVFSRIQVERWLFNEARKCGKHGRDAKFPLWLNVFAKGRELVRIPPCGGA